MIRHMHGALRLGWLVLLAAAYAPMLSGAQAAGHRTKLKPAVTRASPSPPLPVNRPLPMGYDWSGFYAGGFVGGAHGMWTTDFYRNNNHGHADEGLDGLEGGGFAGYNAYVGSNVVAGLEVDLGTTNASQANNIYDNDTSFAAYGAFGSLRGRLGYVMDRIMVYGTAGLAFASISNDIQKGRNAGEEVVWDNQSRLGYALGAGAEYAVSNRWRARAEYLYENFGTANLVNRDGNQASFQNALHQVRLGLSYKF